MMSKLIGFLLILCISLISSLAAAKSINIAILQDGPWLRLEDKIDTIKQEIRNLTDGEFTVRFPANKKLTGDWTVEGVNLAIDQLLADPEIDIIIALGVVASGELVNRKNLNKPIVAPIIVGESTGLPLDKGRSGVNNLNYISAFGEIDKDIKKFREISYFEQLTVISDPLYTKAAKRYGHFNVIKQLPNLKISFIDGVGTAQTVLDQLPLNTEAVLVMPLFRMDSEQIKLLSTKLIDEQLPSFTIFNGGELESGILASRADPQDMTRLARRVAINVQRILLGENPSQLEVTYPLKSKLRINMATASAINISPSFNILNEAEQFNVLLSQASKLTLLESIEQALLNNLDIKTSQFLVDEADADIKDAKGLFLPQIDVEFLARQIDSDRASGSNGRAPEFRSSVNLKISQALYSEQASANLRIREILKQAMQSEQRSRQLDVILETSTGYLNLLRAEALNRIRNDDLLLTESNLERAKVRLNLGVANRAEVSRWISEQATRRREQAISSAQIEQARVNLNRLLNRPLTNRYQTVPTRLDEPYFLMSDKRFLRYIANPVKVATVRSFMVEEGINNLPRLQQAGELIKAQQRSLLSANRVLTRPTIGLQGEITQFLSEGGSGTSELDFQAQVLGQELNIGGSTNDTEWSVGISAKLSLYQGGQKRAAKQKAAIILQRLQMDYDNILLSMEADIRTKVFAAQASFANIELAQQAVRAALDNRDLVTDAYSRGVVEIVDLLDAQSASLRAEQTAANAVFDFLIDWMNLQRATGQFDLMMDNTERNLWYQRLENYFVKTSAQP